MAPESFEHLLPEAGSWPQILFPGMDFGPHEHTIKTVEDARRYVSEHCPACGLRVLHLWLNGRTWIRRRVEHVEFIDDRTVRRRVSVDFVMPWSAPTVNMAGQILTIVPIALLRKKNLVNFDLRDEQDNALSLMGLRQNHALTAAILKGVAAATRPDAMIGDPLPDDVKQVIEAMVFGEKRHVRLARALLNRNPRFHDLASNEFFCMAVDRLEDSWVMCLLLPKHSADARRIIKFSYDEPLSFSFKEPPRFDPTDDRPEPTRADKLRALRSVAWVTLTSRLGLKAARIRFSTPGAESAQSYRFEVTAPPGVDIRSAEALAVRLGDQPPADSTDPPDPETAPVYDLSSGLRPSVDLHLREVKTGSFSMAQVELAAQRGSWLAALTMAACVNFALLALIAAALWNSSHSATIPDVSLLVIFVTVASTFLAERDSHPMLGRLLRPARALAAGSTLCALFVATRIALYPNASHGWWIGLPAAVSCFAALLLLAGTWCLRPRRDRRCGEGAPSDFTLLRLTRRADEEVPVSELAAAGPKPLCEVIHELRFDKAAITVESSESPREQLPWTADIERRANEHLCAAIIALRQRSAEPKAEKVSTATR